MWWAAAAAGLASGSRLVGLALLPSILYLAWRRRASLRDLAAIVLIAPSGLMAFFIYGGVKFNNLFAYFDAQATWGG